MRYLVTGGAGFIGSNYVRMLLAPETGKDIEVVVLDNFGIGSNILNLGSFLEDRRLRIIEGDIANDIVSTEALKKVDVVINFAAESHVDRSLSDPAKFVNSNIVGVEVLLRKSLESGVKRFLQISTDEVYGSKVEGESTEDDPVLPNSPYSASKASADLLVRSYVESFGLNASITRCCNNFGPYQFPEKLIPLFITNLLSEKKVPVYGTGENIREWIYVDDHCAAIQKVVESGKKGEIYNIGTKDRISNLDLTKIILEKLGKPDSQIMHVADRRGHDLRYALNSEKLDKDLGLRFGSNFELRLDETINWYKTNSNWWLPLIKLNTEVSSEMAYIHND